MWLDDLHAYMGVKQTCAFASRAALLFSPLHTLRLPPPRAFLDGIGNKSYSNSLKSCFQKSLLLALLAAESQSFSTGPRGQVSSSGAVFVEGPCAPLPLLHNRGRSDSNSRRMKLFLSEGGNNVGTALQKKQRSMCSNIGSQPNAELIWVDCLHSHEKDPPSTIPSNVGISVRDELGRDVAMDTQDMRDGTFKVTYTANTPGPNYTVQVFFDNHEVPRSPFKVPVKPNVDMNKIHVENLEPSIPVGKPHEFDIITAGAGVGAGPAGSGRPRPNVVVKSPSGLRVPHTLEETVDGFATTFTPTMPGPYTVSVEVGGIAVKGSPFHTVAVAPVPQQAPANEALIAPVEVGRVRGAVKLAADPASLVRAYGDGLRRATAGRPTHFTIDSRDAAPAPLSVTIEGPAEAKIDYVDNGDGTCGVEYLPVEAGPYQVNVLYRDQHVKGSPFSVQVAPAGREHSDASRVRAYGPGLGPNG
ncbi:unnamed protein product [Protopolystoma xenopodis]|uniref:Filamin n=1 Tax=Protopolystoma xenopodis TaxID=117903 RepID=A0A3S4ZYR4_9PLAT|nr:unnamed protein product [Protopolystoma xenopodis]